MIIENTGIKGSKSELRHLDNVMEKADFVRGQWEYYRATYDHILNNQVDGETYYLRINARAIEGKLEDPFAVLTIEEAYVGKTTFPHGVDYNSPIPDGVLNTAKQKLSQLQQHLA